MKKYTRKLITMLLIVGLFCCLTIVGYARAPIVDGEYHAIKEHYAEYKVVGDTVYIRPNPNTVGETGEVIPKEAFHALWDGIDLKMDPPIKNIIIEEGIRIIGVDSFLFESVESSDYNHVEKIIIPDSVTTIKNGAFCSRFGNTKEIRLGKGITSIENYAFFGISNNTTIYYANESTYNTYGKNNPSSIFGNGYNNIKWYEIIDYTQENGSTYTYKDGVLTFNSSDDHNYALMKHTGDLKIVSTEPSNISFSNYLDNAIEVDGKLSFYDNASFSIVGKQKAIVADEVIYDEYNVTVESDKSIKAKPYGGRIYTTGSSEDARWLYTASTKTLSVTGTSVSLDFGDNRSASWKAYTPYQSSLGSSQWPIQKFELCDNIFEIGNNSIFYYTNPSDLVLPRGLQKVGTSIFSAIDKSELNIYYYGNANNNVISKIVTSFNNIYQASTKLIPYYDPKINGKYIYPGTYDAPNAEYGLESGSITYTANGNSAAELVLNNAVIKTDTVSIKNDNDIIISSIGESKIENTGSTAIECKKLTIKEGKISVSAKKDTLKLNGLAINGGYMKATSVDDYSPVYVYYNPTYSANCGALYFDDSYNELRKSTFDTTTRGFTNSSQDPHDIYLGKYFSLYTESPAAVGGTYKKSYYFFSELGVPELPCFETNTEEMKVWKDAKTGGNTITSVPVGTNNDVYIYGVGWTPKVFDITYVIDGGTINSGKVEHYISGYVTTLPTDVTKPKNRFDGWYDDDTFAGSSITQIENTEYGDKTFYAKWCLTGGDLDNEGNTWWSFYNGELQIGGEGEIPNYTSLDDLPWHDSLDLITKISIEDGITKIGDLALAGTSATEVYIEKETGLVEISATAFGTNPTMNFTFFDSIEELLKNAGIPESQLKQFGGNAGTNIRWDYSEVDNTLTFSGSGSISINSVFKKYKDSATTVVLSSGIDEIADGMFDGFNNGTVICANTAQILKLEESIPNWEWKVIRNNKTYYAVDYIVNGGEFKSAPSDEYEYGKEFNLKKNISKDGYRFKGWYTTNNDFSGDDIKKIPADAKGTQRVYAGWEQKITPKKSDPSPLTVIDNGNASATVAVQGNVIVLAEYLDDLARQLNEEDNTKSIDIVLNTNIKAEVDAETEEIGEKSDTEKLVFLEITLTKSIGGQEPVKITDTHGILIEIVAQFDFLDKENIKLFHYHDNESFELTQIDENDTPFDGSFYYNDHEIHIFTTKFSTFAVGYNPMIHLPPVVPPVEPPVEEEIPEEDPEIEIYLNGKKETLRYAHLMRTLPIDRFTFERGLKTVNGNKYVIDLSNDPYAMIEEIVLTNRSVRQLEERGIILSIVLKNGKIEISDFGDTGKDSVKIKLCKGTATYLQKKAVGADRVVDELYFAMTSNGKTALNADVTVTIPAKANIKNVYYIIDEHTVGQWAGEMVKDTFVFKRYKDGTYMTCK